jgi:hypothetical protein
MTSRTAVVMMCCALVVSGCASIEEFLDSLPEPRAAVSNTPGTVANVEGEAVVEGRFSEPLANGISVG